MGDNFVQETGAFLATTKASFTELDDSWKEMKTRVCFFFNFKDLSMTISPFTVLCCYFAV
jgi:hypothetical protein